MFSLIFLNCSVFVFVNRGPFCLHMTWCNTAKWMPAAKTKLVNKPLKYLSTVVQELAVNICDNKRPTATHVLLQFGLYCEGLRSW